MQIEYETLLGIDAKNAEMVWGQLSPYLERALKKTREDEYWGTKDVLKKIQDRDAQLWAIIDEGQVVGAVVTQIEVYPKCKALNLWLGGADSLHPLDEVIKTAKEFGKSHGCEKLKSSGRDGWLKALSEKPEHYTCWQVSI